MATPSSSPHFVIMPFMSKGHTIPLLHLTRLLLCRNIPVTIFTTHANSPFIRQSLANTEASIIDLSFPQDPRIPPRVESTDKLPSMSLFIPFVNATKLLQPEFERVVQSLQPSVSCIISGAFLSWSLESATKFGIPRLAFNGMSNFVFVVSSVVARDRPFTGVDSNDEPFTVPNFPWIKLTKNDYEEQFLDPDPNSPFFQFFQEQAMATRNSMGLLVNSIYELEREYAEYWNNVTAPNKAWYVGPLCLAAEPQAKLKVQALLHKKPIWIQWLDEMLAKGRSVLYVAFGSQADINTEQLREIAIGLDNSRTNFLWVVKPLEGEDEFMNGFEERVSGRGLVVTEWVDQVEILSHKCVDGFMSHCGWNSVMESICASVPILAFPIAADQHLNAKMVVEHLGVGVRVLARNGSLRGFVSSESVANKARELMEGEKGREVRRKAKEVSEVARTAMEEGGSSWRTLDLLIDEVCGKKK